MLRVVDVVQVVDNELHLFLVGDGCCERLELQLLHLLSVSIGNGLDYRIEFLLLLRQDVYWQPIVVVGLLLVRVKQLVGFSLVLQVVDVLLRGLLGRRIVFLHSVHIGDLLH